jgi:nitroreductase
MTLDTHALLSTTRSVRRHLDLSRDVPLELVLECLRVAQQAPNGADAEAWRFVVVRDGGLRGAIGDYYRLANAPFAAAVAARAAGGEAWAARKLASSGVFWDHLEKVPVLVVAGVEEGPDFEATPYGLASAYASVLPAVWSLQLAARLRGLGSCLVTSHLRFAAEISELLQLPPGFRHAGMVAIGHLAKEQFGPAPRRPLGEIVHLDRWGGRLPEGP